MPYRDPALDEEKLRDEEEVAAFVRAQRRAQAWSRVVVVSCAFGFVSALGAAVWLLSRLPKPAPSRICRVVYQIHVNENGTQSTTTPMEVCEDRPPLE